MSGLHKFGLVHKSPGENCAFEGTPVPSSAQITRERWSGRTEKVCKHCGCQPRLAALCEFVSSMVRQNHAFRVSFAHGCKSEDRIPKSDPLRRRGSAARRRPKSEIRVRGRAVHLTRILMLASERESQRDSATKPRVARNELPWETSGVRPSQPRRGCADSSDE